MKFETHEFSAGTIIMVNLWSLHRHRQLWEHPDAFVPARFFGGARDAIDRFQYLPFGMGPRVCIGQRFALQEAAILMAILGKSYSFEYEAPEPPWPQMRITLRAENRMPMMVTKRN